jgi:hypothetical protein
VKSKAGLSSLSAALFAGALAATTASAQYPAAKNTMGEVKRDADLNKPGAAKPPGNTTRVPTQQGRVQQDSDWNKGGRTNFYTPPLRFIGNAGPPEGSQSPLRPFTTAPLSFVGAGPVQPADTGVRVRTERLNFIGAAGKP